MGCDIHSFVEKKNVETGKWEQIRGFKSDYYDENDEYFSTDEFKNGKTILDCRNYSEFAILADVRNGYGFAGCDTGDAIEPIDMPRGLPIDVSDEVKWESDDYGCDGHSHSWLTAKDIKDYAPEKVRDIHRGFVSVEIYKQFKETGNHYPCCGGISGGKVIIESNDACEQRQKDNPDKDVYTQIEWTTTAKDSAKWLFGEGLDQLMARSSEPDGSDVRIVFFFDN